VILAPDFTRGYLRIPLTVWRAVFCRAPLKRRQLQIVAMVIRESWGWHTRGGEVRTWTRPLTSGDFAEATDLTTDHISRDLRELLARGVLYHHNGRYAFNPGPQLWKTAERPAPNQRSLPLETRRRTAESALAASSLKKPYTKIDNVPAQSVGDFSPTVENPPIDVRFTPARLPFEHSLSPIAQASRTAPAPAERFVAVVAAFVGQLSAGDAAALRTLIARRGVSSVWQALEPALRAGRTKARRQLQTLLAPLLPSHSRLDQSREEA